MDPLDRRIVHALLVAPRASFRDLAAVLGTSDQTVARRYRTMQAELDLRVSGSLRETRLGWDRWTVRVTATPDAAVPLAETLAARRDTSWVRLASGGTQVLCAMQTRTPEDRSALLDRTGLLLDRLRTGRRVVGISANLMLNVFSPDAWSWLSSALSDEEVAALARHAPGHPDHPDHPDHPGHPAAGRARLSEADEALVGLLRADGRASAASLAAATGWHESTVRRRIAQLTSSGALQFDVDLDEEAIGIEATAYLWLSVDPGALDATGRQIARHHQAPFVAAITGPANLLVSVTCRDASHLYRYLTEQLGQIPAVRAIESVPIVKTYKRTALVRPRSGGS